MPHRVRTFVAVEVSQFTHDRLRGLQEQMAALAPAPVNWVAPANWHVTLHFLGDVDERELYRLCRAVEKAAAAVAPFTLELSGVGAFPNLRRPKVIYAGVGQGADELVGLHTALIAPLEDLGTFRREARPYTPHMTLGRVQHEADAEALGSVVGKFLPWRGGDSPVREVALFSSVMGPDGPEYAVLSRGRLKG